MSIYATMHQRSKYLAPMCNARFFTWLLTHGTSKTQGSKIDFPIFQGHSTDRKYFYLGACFRPLSDQSSLNYKLMNLFWLFTHEPSILRSKNLEKGRVTIKNSHICNFLLSGSDVISYFFTYNLLSNECLCM